VVGLVVAGISSDIKQMRDHGKITRFGFVHGELSEVGSQDVINISNLQHQQPSSSPRLADR